ncbi:TetR/AcrR family transcriptional regulator [Rhodococcus sp. BP-252]|uniref:TetR family transcriptional regulator n=1 Tax=Rhodococcoides kyotonense TaxID=398843 RepID=A0A177YPM7_9NOCA|nr:TetR/AcrR family transcriptional regulator [Rhodococcus sp. BP-320]MBY6415887.1 TetR/AcrR family transcriptional regulator [Rhodococcus sp. BP-321]MBY6420604.1 TetR/AcrR family transcriptional regulator [Rhodococcus sp. BP-324]MBY6426094.1 TetR/AcrR family transcriptional regulator [Rhodococcus sp. BP-323]MBY6431365.1 TetR/AcrR family transcriptional regulator [Rhodococcus sp. BP-322]MBY6440307.1 TetR/AcrR family transcriptional regulator [Rhodococcus sp. BP-319]MBY6444930.1 TetR/AcrR fami
MRGRRDASAADSVTDTAPPARSGRRPGRSGTKDAILTVARRRFAEAGFDRASVRSIASDAGVDSALVHHYFGTKRDLFVAAVALPVDPDETLKPILAADIDVLGPTLARTILGVWDSENGQGIVAAFRSMIASGDTSLISSFLLQIALRDTAVRVDVPAGSGLERVGLVASQMAGLLLTRHILELEPIASMPADRLVAVVGPTLQRYLTGPLPD